MSFFHGKRIVVTGAAGFVGSHVVRLLRNTDCEIVRVVHESRARLESGGRARVKNVSGDVRDPLVWRRALPGADIVFHLAAQTSARVAEQDAAADWEQNVVPMHMLLNLCGRRTPAIVFASTVTIAEFPTPLPVSESAIDGPITAYDLHKKLAEVALEPYPRGVSLRLANAYGDGPPSRHADRGMLNAMIARALAGDVLNVYGEGTHIRDYVHVHDVARAFLAAARGADKIAGRYFVIGSGRGYSIADAVALVSRRVARATGTRAEVRHIPPPAPPLEIDARDFAADSRAFRRATGWRARVTLAAGIDLTVAAMRRRARSA